jgi:hypothetical protein
LEDIRQCVERLVQALRQSIHAERLLILDSMTTDIGVCD